MSDPNVKLTEAEISALTSYIKKREGLFGALHLRGVMQKCECEICAEIRKAITENKS